MTTFKVWAPEKEKMILHIVSPFEKEISMSKDDTGFFSCEVDNGNADVRYYFRPDEGDDYPDPASPFQPDGVHGASQTVDHNSFTWSDNSWKGAELRDLIFYEIHVGTFTNEGTFEAIIPRLDDLIQSGINAIEIMPVSQFPGNRNWGYDGVFPYAVQNSYGGPVGLKKLVDACHAKGIAVFLDVVYNHVGPEGNYFGKYGPYFTEKYSTPWGDALNFDGDWSDGVREYFSDNVLYWFQHYHIDGLRCDAIHTVYDTGAIHFWELVYEKVNRLEEQTGRKHYLIAESDLNSPKVVKTPEQGGYGFDAQWLDDFHHALYKMVNPEEKERYYDFGKIEQLAKAYKEGFVHSGEWVKFRKRKHGVSSAQLDGEKFIAFNLNHDQVGNRAGGERLCMLVDDDRMKLAAAVLFLSPYIPMLFMGEEYADDTPFFYFVSHSEEELINAVREGRKSEFEEFGFNESVPDPQDEQTFKRSVIHWEKRNEGRHKQIREWHEQLISLRRESAVLKNFRKQDVDVIVINEKLMRVNRADASGRERLTMLFNFSEHEYAVAGVEGTKILDSKNIESDNKTKIVRDVTIAPWSVAVYKS